MRLFLLFATWMFCAFASAQVPEGVSMSNIDTAAIQRKIVYGRAIGEEKPDSAKLLFTEAYRLSRRILYKPGAKWALLYLGHLHNRENQYDSARQYYFLALAYAEREDSLLIARIFKNIGQTYSIGLRPDLAVAAYMKAVAYGSTEQSYLAGIYCDLGNAFNFLSDDTRALRYYNQSLSLARQFDDTSTWCGILMNTGNVYSRLGQMDSALFFLDSAFRMSKRYHLVREFATTAVNLSALYLELSRKTEALEVISQAMPFLDSTVLHARERNMLFFQGGKVYAALGQYNIAIDYLQRAQEYVQGDAYLEMHILNTLSEVYAAKGDYHAALVNMRYLYAMQDSLGTVQMAAKAHELETRYRTAEKDKAIAEGLVRIQAQELRLHRQRNWVGGAIGGSMLLLLLASWRYTHMRQKHRRLQSQMEVEQLKAEMVGEEKERARIASELHDGIVAELTAIKMNLEVAGRRLPEAPLAYREHLRKLSAVINEIRNTAHNLMPEILLRHGLAEAVGLLCETIGKTGRLNIEYQHYGDFRAISQPMRQSVYRILQELLHNIIKHAKASRALLQLSCNDGLLAVELEDNGVGMKEQRGVSMGVTSIERRVQEWKGSVAWSAPDSGSGTQVHLEFELVREGRGRVVKGGSEICIWC